MSDAISSAHQALVAYVQDIIGSWDCRVRLIDHGDDLFLYAADGELLFQADTAHFGALLKYVQETDRLLKESPPPISAASQIKSTRRGRPADPAVTCRREALIDLVDRLKPATVRQVFYAATINGLVDKTEDGYGRVQNDLVLLRRSGRLPYGWLADSTRWQRKPNTHASIDEALEETARFYRRALWADADCYVEVWLEKDALAGVVTPITSKNDVPLMVSRGYASLSFLHSAAEYISEIEKPTYIYHLGDYDPSGQDAARAIETTLREMAPDAEIHFTRLAVTQHQIEAWKLPSRPTKKSDTRAAKFGSDISVELDAISPGMLRGLVERAIRQHLPQDQLQVLLEAEQSERAILQDLIGSLRGAA